MLRAKKNAPHPPTEEPEFFLVPLSFARRGARGEVFRNFHVRDSQKIIDPLFTLEITGIAHSYSSNFLK